MQVQLHGDSLVVEYKVRMFIMDSCAHRLVSRSEYVKRVPHIRRNRSQSWFCVPFKQVLVSFLFSIFLLKFGDQFFEAFGTKEVFGFRIAF